MKILVPNFYVIFYTTKVPRASLSDLPQSSCFKKAL